MARNLQYARIPQALAKGINFTEVMENSWDTARWDTDSGEVMVHWVGDTPRSIDTIIRNSRGQVDPPSDHPTEIAYIKSSRGKVKWEDAGAPPKKK
jgi:hypothetical protein